MAKSIALTQGFHALVDDEDYDFLVTVGDWHYAKGYAATWCREKRCPLMMHDFIARRKGISGLIDHKDRNPLNNTRDNLRVASKSQNGMNAKLSKASTSKIKGVSRDRTRWRAHIVVNGKQVHLGSFGTKEEAAIARKDAERHFFGEFAT